MPAAPELRAHVDRDGQTFVITVSGDVDYAAMGGFDRAWEAADRAAMPVTAVDLTGVTFADSMLLNALIKARLRHQASGRDLVLVGPLRTAVSRLLTITGAIRVFTVVEGGRGSAHDSAAPRVPEPEPRVEEVGQQHRGADDQQVEQSVRGEPDDAQDEGHEDQQQEKAHRLS